MKSELTSSSGARLIPVTPGSFIMGSPQSEVGHEFWEREREVTLNHEFYLGATPVTQRQVELVMPCFPRQFAHHPTSRTARSPLKRGSDRSISTAGIADSLELDINLVRKHLTNGQS